MCRHRQAVVFDIHLIHSELFNKFNIIYFLPILDTTYWNIGLVLLKEKYLMASSEINLLANLYYPFDLLYSALFRFHRGLCFHSKPFVLFIKITGSSFRNNFIVTLSSVQNFKVGQSRGINNSWIIDNEIHGMLYNNAYVLCFRTWRTKKRCCWWENTYNKLDKTLSNAVILTTDLWCVKGV